MAKGIPLAASAADVQGVSGPVVLVGFSARETGGASTADITLRDGTTASDPIRAVIRLVANGSQAAPLPAVEFTTGIFVDRSGSGTSELVLYTN